MLVAPSFSLGVILLGAGRSQRMGRPKLLLPWGDTSIIGHLINQWGALRAEQVTVVCASSDSLIHTELDRLQFSVDNRILNPAPERGMFSSIQCAAQWPGWRTALTHWAIVLGDQPHLSQYTLQTLIDLSIAHPGEICLPKQEGHRRHPVFLPKASFRYLAASTHTDLKSFLNDSAQSVVFFDSNDPGLGFDLDFFEDYERAVRMFFPKTG